MARYSEAHNKAHKKWLRENRWTAGICLPKEFEIAAKNKAKKYGSLNAYFKHLLEQDLGIDSDGAPNNLEELEREEFIE